MNNILTPSKYELWLDKAREVEIYVNDQYAFTHLTSRTLDSVKWWVRLLYPKSSQISVVEV